MSYTLTTLKSSIQDYTENSETTFITHLRDFVRSAENRLFKMVDFEYFRKNATSATTTSDPYFSVPTDFLSPISLSITNSSSKEFLLEKDVNFVQEYHPNVSTTGTPKYYSRFDVDNFILAPTPDANYSSEIHYYYRPTSLADSVQVITVASSSSFNSSEVITGTTSGATGTISSKDDSANTLSIGTDATTTWLSINAMNAMLYGSLAEAYIYMKGEADMMALYEKRFMEEVSRLKDFAEARENSDAYRQGLPRRPRT